MRRTRRPDQSPAMVFRLVRQAERDRKAMRRRYGEIAADHVYVSRLAALPNRLFPAKDRQAARAVVQAREVLAAENRKRQAAAATRRDLILALARHVSRRQALTKTAVARAVRGQLATKLDGETIPSVRSIRRMLPR